jgi:hypothetical protein
MCRKVIQHYADVLCHMAIGWRMGDDLETLSDLPDGSIEINLLTGESNHSVTGPLDLRVGREMQAWLINRSDEDHISIQHILGASIRLKSKTDGIRTDKKRLVFFEWSCDSNISTDQKTYESHLKEAHTWHNRIQHANRA